MKTAELTGAALDWMAAKCDNRKIGFNPGGGLEVRGRTEDGEELPEHWDLWMPWHPSTDWAQAGPIIERESIGCYKGAKTMIDPEQWYAYQVGKRGEEHTSAGPTPLIAAMRCYVASKLGDEVEVPDELA